MPKSPHASFPDEIIAIRKVTLLKTVSSVTPVSRTGLQSAPKRMDG
jgi:hypothetical protein